MQCVMLQNSHFSDAILKKKHDKNLHKQKQFAMKNFTKNAASMKGT